MSTNNDVDMHELFKFLVNEQFRISNNNVTYDDIVKEYENGDREILWQDRYFITEDQEKEFKKVFKDKVMEDLGATDKDSEVEFFWFAMKFGLERKKE